MTGRVTTLIVGGGITGLAAAHRLVETGHTDWLLVEREPRLGGKIQTDHVSGFVVERGPDCFLASKPAGVALCRDLGIEERLIPTSATHRRAFTRRHGRLYEMPAGITGLVPTRLAPILNAPVLSPRARLRAALELFVPRRTDGREESIADFVSRRFGPEAYDWLIEPLVSGIFAGDGRELSLSATFPQLAEIERCHRSVIRMMLAKRWRADSDRSRSDDERGFVTLPGGMRDLVEAIEGRLPAGQLRRGVTVRALRQTPGGLAATLSDDTRVTSGSVILAVPASLAADLVQPLDRTLAARLNEIPFVSTATVSVAFAAGATLPRFDGYGIVSPRAAGGPLVACTWTSNKFPMRAPAGATLMRFFLGRAGNDAIVTAPAHEIEDLVRAELGLLGIVAIPSHWWISRWRDAMPQYTVGHERRVRAIEAAAARHPGLIVAGASYTGVGIPDCIGSGRRAADRARGFAREGMTRGDPAATVS